MRRWSWFLILAFVVGATGLGSFWLMQALPPARELAEPARRELPPEKAVRQEAARQEMAQLLEVAQLAQAALAARHELTAEQTNFWFLEFQTKNHGQSRMGHGGGLPLDPEAAALQQKLRAERAKLVAARQKFQAQELKLREAARLLKAGEALAVRASVDEALAILRAANVAFNTPDNARVGRQFIVEAKLSTHLRPEDMESLIIGPGKREVAALMVSDQMAASLSGGSAFDVSPSGMQEQLISDRETTSWIWQVTPKSVGEQVLILSFDALINFNGQEGRRTINTFERRISVDVSWPQTAGEWLEFVKTTGEKLSWIWATLLIPIGGGIWAWIKHRSRRSKPTRKRAHPSHIS